VRTRRRAAAAALLALALLGAACGGGDDDKKNVATNASTSSTVGGSTTSTTADPNATSTTVETGPDTTVASGGPDTTAGTAPPVTAPPATAPPGPVALTPAVPGVYHYITSGGINFAGTPAPFPADTTNTIGAPAGTVQVATRNLGSGATGSQATYTFDYRPDGLYLVSLVLTVTYNGAAYPLPLTPPAPALFLATGAAAGASQTLIIPSSSGPATVVVTVLGTEPVTVGTTTLDTLIVRSVATFPAGGQVQGSQTLLINLDRASRLWVRERANGVATAFGFTVTTDYVATLKSLTPG
jgi:hypothetical protein